MQITLHHAVMHVIIMQQILYQIQFQKTDVKIIFVLQVEIGKWQNGTDHLYAVQARFSDTWCDHRHQLCHLFSSPKRFILLRTRWKANQEKWIQNLWTKNTFKISYTETHPMDSDGKNKLSKKVAKYNKLKKMFKAGGK